MTTAVRGKREVRDTGGLCAPRRWNGSEQGARSGLGRCSDDAGRLSSRCGRSSDGYGRSFAGYGRTCEPSRHVSRAGRTQGRLRRSSFVARALRAGTEALASQPTAGLAPPWREWPRQRPGYAVHKFELQPRCGCRPGMLHSWAPPAALSACSPWRRRWQQVSPCSGTRPWLRPSLPSRPSSGLVWLFGTEQ